MRIVDEASFFVLEWIKTNIWFNQMERRRNGKIQDVGSKREYL